MLKIIPKDHMCVLAGHHIGIDPVLQESWSTDRGLPGNGYCFTCKMPIEVEVEDEEENEEKKG